MVSITDLADRPPRALADGEELALGGHTVQWVRHAPCAAWLGLRTADGGLDRHVLLWRPVHAARHGAQALTEADILGPSEAFRLPMDYYAHAPHTAATLARLAEQKPRTLACMHGSAWRGDGGTLLRHLAEAVSAPR
jgi:hypothetical protein